jgi:SAM-dependent methyltransferase
MKKKLSDDLTIEQERYDKVALNLQDSSTQIREINSGIENISMLHQTPFQIYYDAIRNNIEPADEVLEFGSGTGVHTKVIFEKTTKVSALDISLESLKLCKIRFPDINLVHTNMEQIPLRDNSFNAIVSCGSLSYGDPVKVNAEINRILKPGGKLIILDTLNHNLVYKINRWVRFKAGHRTRSTLKRMPTLNRIQPLHSIFLDTEIRFYGSYLWFSLILEKLLGSDLAFKLNSSLEKCYPSKKNAYKFIFIGLGHTKSNT